MPKNTLTDVARVAILDGERLRACWVRVLEEGTDRVLGRAPWAPQVQFVISKGTEVKADVLDQRERPLLIISGYSVYPGSTLIVKTPENPDFATWVTFT